METLPDGLTPQDHKDEASVKDNVGVRKRVGPHSSSRGSADDSLPQQKQPQVTQTASLLLEWYQNTRTLDHWAERGAQALKALDIPVDHGMFGHSTMDDSASSYSESSEADRRSAKRPRKEEIEKP